MDQAINDFVREGLLALQESVSDLHGVVGRLSEKTEITSHSIYDLRNQVVAWQAEQRSRISGLERQVLTEAEARRAERVALEAADAALSKMIASEMARAEEDRQRYARDREAMDRRTSALEEDRRAMRFWIKAGVALVCVIIPAFGGTVGYVLSHIPPEAWHQLSK